MIIPGAVAISGEVNDGFDYGVFADIRRPVDPDAPEEDPATRLRRLIEQRQTESIEILRGWMEEEEHA